MLIDELLRQRNVLSLIPWLGISKPKGRSQGWFLVVIKHTREPLKHDLSSEFLRLLRNLDHLHGILLEFIHGHKPLLLGESHQGDYLLESGNFLNHPGQLDPISHGLSLVLVSIELEVDPQDLGIM